MTEIYDYLCESCKHRDVLPADNPCLECMDDEPFIFYKPLSNEFKA